MDSLTFIVSFLIELFKNSSFSKDYNWNEYNKYNWNEDNRTGCLKAVYRIIIRLLLYIVLFLPSLHI
jgi:hypothetical protein